MNNILAAKVLISKLPNINDNSEKRATEIAIESLLLDSVTDWHKADTELTVLEYLEMSKEEYAYWILGARNLEEICMRNTIEDHECDDADDEAEDVEDRELFEMIQGRLEELLEIVNERLD